MTVNRRRAEVISREVETDEGKVIVSTDFTRNFEDITEDDVVNIKMKIKEEFENDPDLLRILGCPDKKVLNSYADEANPTEKELEIRKEIIEFNNKVDNEMQIIPWIKLNPLDTDITTVKNHIMYDVRTERLSYDNPAYKSQYIDVVCMVKETDMKTQFGIPRADLLAYIIKDLLHNTNLFGCHVTLAVDEYQITDNSYYWRRLCFRMDSPNFVPGHGAFNKYDRLW